MKPVAYITEDGEIKSSTEEPDFVKLYFRHIVHVVGLNGASDHLVFYHLVGHMGWDNSLYVTKPMKIKIGVAVGWTTGNGHKVVERHIARLVEHGLLGKVARGHYKVNPFLVAKGKWEDIKQLQASGAGRIKFDMEFEATGKVTFNSVIIKGGQ